MHVITVKDAQKCLRIDSVLVGQPAAVALTLSKTDITCHGANNGTVTALFSETGASIRLDNGSFVSTASPVTFTGLAPGKHVVTLKNASNCSGADSVQIVQPDALSLTLVTTAPSTLTSSDGTVIATFGGGTPGYAVSFDHGPFVTASSPDTFRNLANDLYYTVLLRDTALCEAIDSIVVGLRTGIPYSLQEHWNLLSVPVGMGNASIASLFPTASGPAIQYYQKAYHLASTVEGSAGFWLTSTAATSLTLTGVPHLEDTLAVTAGWNLIGSHYEPVAVTDIRSDVPGIVTSQFFGYAGTYAPSDTIHPGRAYWAKVSADSRLFLSSHALTLARSPIRVTPATDRPPTPPHAEGATAEEAPATFALQANYPNPFNPSTVIRYQLPEATRVTLRVFDMLGQEVGTLVDGTEEAGFKSVTWDAATFASGVYYYRLTAGTFHEIRKMILLR
jgi:hypothetical protein